MRHLTLIPTRFLLFFLCSVVFIVPLFFFDIVGFNEAQDGLRLHAFVSSVDEGVWHWLFPSIRKPPLFYWLGGIVTWLRDGIVDARSVRLPSALLASYGVFTILWLGRVVASAETGRVAALVLLTAPLYVEQGRMARPDMALCFFVTLSLSLFFVAHTHSSLRNKRQPAWLPFVPYGFGLGLLGALFSTGPVGVILIALPIGAFAVWRRELTPIRLLCKPGPILIVLFVGLGWYAGAAWWQPHHFWHTQIEEENLGRFFGSLDVLSPLYYLDVIFLRFAPWGLFLPIAVWRAFRSREEGPVFLALWWATITVFFHLAAYKRARYLLPMFPPAALLVGWWFSTQRETLSKQMQSWASWASWQNGLKFGWGAAVIVICIGFSALASTRSDQQTACQIVLGIFPAMASGQAEAYCGWLGNQIWLGLGVWVAFAVSLGACLFSLSRVQLVRAFGFLVAVLVLVHAVLHPSWLMIDSTVRSPHRVAQQVIAHTQEAGRVFLLTPLTATEDPDVAGIFHVQPQVRVVNVWWPTGDFPLVLPKGYYLVPANRKREVMGSAHGRWHEIRIEKEGTPWAFVLLAHTARLSRDNPL